MTPEAGIRVMCPNLKCKTILSVPKEARGRLVRCRSCGATIQVPQKAASAGSKQQKPNAA